MKENKNIFNFISNSYSQFLSDCSIRSISTQGMYAYAKNEQGQPLDFDQLVYNRNKRFSKVYQSIFYGFSLFFFVLATIIYYNTTNWACSIYFQHCAFIKTFTYSTCFVFSVISLVVAHFSNPEKETALFLIQRVKKHLKNLYKQKRIESGSWLAFCENKRIKRELCKQSYHQAQDKIQEQKAHIFHLLDRISQSEQFDTQMKEVLVQQAFNELQSTLNSIIQSFKQKCYLLAINQNKITDV